MMHFTGTKFLLFLPALLLMVAKARMDHYHLTVHLAVASRPLPVLLDSISVPMPFVDTMPEMASYARSIWL